MKKKTRSHKTALPKNLKVIGRSIGVALVVLIVVAIVIAVSKIFTVQAVECQLSDGSNCPDELTSQIDMLKTNPMFFTDYAHILTQNSTVAQPYSLQKISKRLPSTLRTTFAAEQPLLLLHQTGSYHVISASGKAFTQTEETAANLSHLLLVETNEKIIQNNIVTSDFLSTMNVVVDSIDEYLLPIEKVTWVDKSAIKLSMKERQELIIIDSESPAIQLQRLFLILQSKEYENLPESKLELDVRFTMPVLRTTQ